MIPKIPDKYDTLIHNCHLATMAKGSVTKINNGALLISNGKIIWVGKEKDLPPTYFKDRQKTRDCNERWVLPGLIDCHTHLVWAGSRSNEFEMRLNGVSYEEIAQQGGGILSTVNATRKASEDDLFHAASKRVHALLSQGVTTLEIKSGYGLDLAAELKMLRVIRRLNEHSACTIHPTFLGSPYPAPGIFWRT
jgi:imidazolonepropionase